LTRRQTTTRFGLCLILLVVITSSAEAQPAKKLPVVAVLSTGSPAQSAPTVEAFRQGRIGVALQPLEARGPDDFDRVLQAAAGARAGALLAFGDPVLTAHRAQLASAAIKHRVPAVYELSGFAEAGGLATYGPSLPGMFRGAAAYVDKILKGARPAELPIEQPSTFERVINLKTARTLGLAMPHAVLLRADRVID